MCLAFLLVLTALTVLQVRLDLLHAGAVNANDFVQILTVNAEVLAPICNI